MVCLLLGACSATPEEVVARGDAADAATQTPGGIPSARTDAGEDVLLHREDLPGWTFSGPSAHAPEPTWNASDCPLLNSAWSAHAEPGVRVRANIEGVSLRNTVVQLPDEATAGAVLDAVAAVWETCPSASVDASGTWWIEPIAMEEVSGWRGAALALGPPGDLIWFVGVWQRDATVVVLDIDSNDWTTAEALLATAGARLAGSPVALPAPTPGPVTTVPTSAPSLPAEPTLPEVVVPGVFVTPGTIDLPTPTPRPSWEDHPLAARLDEPSVFGPGWTFESGGLVAERPGGSQDNGVAGCDVAEPPTPAGVEVWYLEDDSSARLQTQLLEGTQEEALANVAAFRALAACDLAELGATSVESFDMAPGGADDAVAVTMVVDRGGESGVVAFFVAAYDDLVVAIYIEQPDAAAVDLDPIVRWVEHVSQDG